MTNELRISSPADILSFIPHTLGFAPRESFVFITMRGNMLGATLRVDAPKDAKINRFSLNKYSTKLRNEFSFVKDLNSINRRKARKLYSKKHLRVNRQRNEHAKRLARNVCLSNDIIAYEDLRVVNLLKNHCLAKSISDASWYQFRQWIEHCATKFGRLAVAVPPQYTSQECSQCSCVVKKSLSTRTHVCSCGLVLQRDWNAAINILRKAKSRGGHPQSNATGVGASTLLGALPGRASSDDECRILSDESQGSVN